MDQALTGGCWRGDIRYRIIAARAKSFYSFCLIFRRRQIAQV
jgi:hypothetical protein